MAANLATSSPASPLILQSSPALPASQQSAATQISSQTTTPPTSQPHGRRRRRSPRKGSLMELMQRHSGASLFVRPICWSDFHAQLLGVQFTELPPITHPVPLNEPGSPPSKGHLRPSATISELSQSLSELLAPTAAHPIHITTCVRSVLGMLWPNAFRKAKLLPELHLFFGDRVYRDAVRAQLMWNYPDSTASSQCSVQTASTNIPGSHSVSMSTQPHNPANLPMVCYLSKAQLASIRRNMFRVASAPGSMCNEPVYRLQQLRSQALAPSDPDRDVHLAGIFLGMAQKHFYATMPPTLRKESPWTLFKDKMPRPTFADLSLRILTHDSETSEFIVYSGHVTAKFLERFYYPHKAPLNDAREVDGLEIELTRVPIWPILGLRERLGQALGEEIVGAFDPTVMETWNAEETVIPCANPVSTKRKREALSEVFNGSFESETDTEPAGDNNKRRRLQEGPPLAMVV